MLLTLGNTTTDTLKRIKQILVLVNNSYHSLNTSNSWNFPSGHHAARDFKHPPKCFNCGKPHLLPDCNKPCDDGKIARNRKAHTGKGGVKEEIKEATIATRNVLKMEVEVVTKKMIIQITATAAFR